MKYVTYDKIRCPKHPNAKISLTHYWPPATPENNPYTGVYEDGHTFGTDMLAYVNADGTLGALKYE